MKVISLLCPCSPEQKLPLDHHDHCKGVEGRRIPPKLARRILKSIESDESHRGGNITVTRLLGCARETLISDFLPIDLDLRTQLSMTWGLAMEGWIRGDDAIPKKRLSGHLFGVEVSGEPDEINGLIDDYKVHNEVTQRFTAAAPPKPELVAQLNLYRILHEMQNPELVRGKFGDYEVIERDSKGMGAFHGANTPKNSPVPPWFYQEIPLMTSEQIGAMRPLGGGYTVEEIAETLQTAVEKIIMIRQTPCTMNDIEAVARVIKEVPLMGESQKYGKSTKCEYCSVALKCGELAGRRRL